MEGLAELESLTVYSLVGNETDGLSSACGCCATAGTGVSYVGEFARMGPSRGTMDFDLAADAALQERLMGLSMEVEA